MKKVLSIDEIVGNKSKNIGGLLPLSKSTFLRQVKKGRFPQPIYLSPKKIVWDQEKLIASLEDKKWALK